MTKDQMRSIEEALDLALEALEYIHKGANNQGPHTGISWRCVAVKAEPAIKAIKQARALDKKADNARELGLDYEPVQEMPITMQAGDKDCRDAEQICEELKAKVEQGQSCYCPNCEALSKELAALKAQPAPVQEPVAYWIPKAEQFCIADPSGRPFAKAWEPLYTTPPAAPLQKPLTDKHIERIYHRYGGNMIHCARAIERAVSAAQRPVVKPHKWVGLTDEEFENIELGCRSTPFGKIEAMQKVEAKLKEKNT